MQAVRCVAVGRPAQIEDVRKPSPGAEQVLMTEFPLTEAVDVYARLKAGPIAGPAVA